MVDRDSVKKNFEEWARLGHVWWEIKKNIENSSDWSWSGYFGNKIKSFFEKVGETS